MAIPAWISCSNGSEKQESGVQIRAESGLHRAALKEYLALGSFTPELL
jgi:hypothetical protein